MKKLKQWAAQKLYALSYRMAPEVVPPRELPYIRLDEHKLKKLRVRADYEFPKREVEAMTAKLGPTKAAEDMRSRVKYTLMSGLAKEIDEFIQWREAEFFAPNGPVIGMTAKLEIHLKDDGVTL